MFRSRRFRSRSGRAGRAGLAAMVAVVAGACLTTGALAQPDTPGVPDVPTMPRPRFADKPPIIRNYLLAVLLGAAVAAPNFIPSKRGHQD